MAAQRFASFAMLATSLAPTLLAGPAHAAWGAITNLPAMALESDPSCAAEDNGIAVCAAIGPGSRFYETRWNNTSWSAWAYPSVGTTVVTSAPSCAKAAAGQVICAARDTGLKMTAFEDTNGFLSPAVTVNVPLGSAPSCGALGPGEVLCAGRSTAGKLAGAWFNGSNTWSSAGWTVIRAADSTVYSPVSCTNGGDAGGDAICVWLTAGNATATRLFNGTSWSAELNIGGDASNPPVCTGDVTENNGLAIACFVTGSDNGLFVNSYNGSGFALGSWSGWGSVGGLVHGFSCAQTGEHAMTIGFACGVTGLTDTGFDTDDYNDFSWSGYTRQGTGTYIGNPSCFALDTSVTPGKVMCVVTKQNGQAASIVGP